MNSPTSRRRRTGSVRNRRPHSRPSFEPLEGRVLLSTQPEMTVADAVVFEEDGGGFGTERLQFAVTLSEPAASDVTVQFRTLTGTAIEDVDFEGEGSQLGSLFIAAGEQSGVIQRRVVADTEAEVDEFMVLELINPENAAFAGGASRLRAIGTIRDNDGIGNDDADRGLFVGDAQLVEGDDGTQNAVFPVRLSRPSDSVIELNYTTADGSAVAGEDFEATTGTVRFEPGQTAQAVAVPVFGDEDLEGTEVFSLVVSPDGSIANGVAGASGAATILDDDASASEPVLSVSDGLAVEADGGGFGTERLQFAVTLSEPAASDVTVQFRTLTGTAIEDVDFEGEGSQLGSLFIAAGEQSGVIQRRVVADTEAEVDEFMVLELINPENAAFAGGASRLRAIGTIRDNDGIGNDDADRGLFVGDVEQLEGTGQDGEAAVPVLLSRPVDQEVSIDFEALADSALAGSDFLQEIDTLTFLPGQTSAAAFVTIVADERDEPNEVFQVRVTPPDEVASGAEGTLGEVTILDDDDPPTVALSMTGSPMLERDGVATVMATLSSLSGRDITVNLDFGGSATISEDFQPSDTSIVIPAGETSGSITLTAIEDNENEPDETITVAIADLIHAVEQGDQEVTAVIADNDPIRIEGDFDGDRQTDLALYHFDAASGTGVFSIQRSSDGSTRTRTLGGRGDVPLSGDFDGDGIADLAVVNPNAILGGGTTPNATVWTILESSQDFDTANPRVVPFGAAGVLDRPAPADFDGDGITDIATFRADSDLVPGAAQWFILPSDTESAFSVVFGAAGGVDLPAPTDFDGDGRADIATFRPVSDLVPGAAQWFILPSGPNEPNFGTTDGAFAVTFGAAGNADQPATADFDGDGRADITAFRSESDLEPGFAQWFILPSTPNAPFYQPPLNGGFPVTFGEAGDIASVGDFDGDGRDDLAVFNRDLGRWRIRTGTSEPEVAVDFGPTGENVVPVISPLFFRLRAAGQFNQSGFGRAALRGSGITEADPTRAVFRRALQGPSAGRRTRLVDLALFDMFGD